MVYLWVGLKSVKGFYDSENVFSEQVHRFCMWQYEALLLQVCDAFLSLFLGIGSALELIFQSAHVVVDDGVIQGAVIYALFFACSLFLYNYVCKSFILLLDILLGHPPLVIRLWNFSLGGVLYPSLGSNWSMMIAPSSLRTWLIITLKVIGISCPLLLRLHKLYLFYNN